MNNKINIVVSGIGNRSLPKSFESSNFDGWIKQISQSEHFNLVGVHDTANESLERIILSGYIKKEDTFQNFDHMLEQVDCEAILISSPAEFHYTALEKSINNNLKVLVEKPLVTNLVDGQNIIEKIKKEKATVLVAQNWRAKDVGQLLKMHIEEGKIGRVGQVFFRYIRNRENPNYPKYIYEESYPLLYAMGIHHIDFFRYILNDEIKLVSSFSFKPYWSLYSSDTGMQSFMKTKSGIIINYTGTLSSLNNAIAQESLIVEGEGGSFINDSDWSEPPLYFIEKGKNIKVDITSKYINSNVKAQYDKADALLLHNFYEVIKFNKKPICNAEDAFKSIAVLEACRNSFDTMKPVYL